MRRLRLKLRLARWNFWAKSHGGEREVVESTSGENRPRDPSRAEFLRKAASGLAAAVGGGIAVAIGGGKVVKAADCNNLLLGKSGDPNPACPPPPNLAEHATEVQLTGAASPPPKIVFLAQADNTYTPAAAFFPAALAGWTSTNPTIPNGVYGFTTRPNGNGVVGWATATNNSNGVLGQSFCPNGSGVVGLGASGANSNGVLGQSSDPNGVGGAFIGPNRAPLNLQPVMVNQPPPTGQCGDLYVTVNVDNHCTLWFHNGINWQICCQ